MKSNVAVVKCDDYDYDKVKYSVKKSLALIGGLKKIVKPEDNVLLKVNLIGPFPPESAATTHPIVVKAMCELINDVNAKAIIGDSAGVYSDESATPVFKASGIYKAAKEANATILNFEKNGYRKMAVPKGKEFKELYFAKAVLDADVVVSLPKLKTHALALYTGAVKNFFGCIPSRERKRSHRLTKIEPFSQSLIDIYSLANCKLAVMDAVVGMEGNGPTHGKPRKLGAIIAGYDAVAVDSVSSYLMGFKPLEIPHIRLAAEQGYGAGNLDDIGIIGDNIDMIKTNFKKTMLQSKLVSIMPAKIVDVIQNMLISEPYLNKDNCTKCKACMNSCPVKAITMMPYPVIDRRKCILCYCCHENCPTGAMELRKSYIGKAISKLRAKIGK